MPKVVAEPIKRKTLLLNPRRIRELVRILNADAEAEAVRKAVADTVTWHRMYGLAEKIRTRRLY